MTQNKDEFMEMVESGIEYSVILLEVISGLRQSDANEFNKMFENNAIWKSLEQTIEVLTQYGREHKWG